MRATRQSGPTDAAFVLPLGLFGMLVIGAIAVVCAPSERAGIVTTATCALVAGLAAATTTWGAAALAVLGEFTVSGFVRAPIGDLHQMPWPVAGAVLAAGAAGAAAGPVHRRRGREDRAAAKVLRTALGRFTLNGVRLRPRLIERFGPAARQLTAGLSRRRLAAGLLLAALLLPAITAVLDAVGGRVALVNDVLVYLLAVVVITIIGGFWAAVIAALSAGFLLNWFFTPPLHTWTIDSPTNMFALLLFLTTAVTVSSVVHLAGRRRELASARTAEADALLGLARTVLRGDDSPQSILDHLTATLGVSGHLDERVGQGWVRVAGSGPATDTSGFPISAGDSFRLCVHGHLTNVSPRLLEGFATQAASACERHRLRIQAEQSETLAAANRMRTALLAAVSHDLRTPLASVKASVSSLRQRDVSWSDEDRAALLATIEEGTNRLSTLIDNLLDMSRIQTGAIEPFLRPVALDEVLPAILRAVERGGELLLDVPDDLPLLHTDPVLLERVVVNLASNALRYSPPDAPPTLVGRVAPDGRTVEIAVVDHGPGIPQPDRERVFQPFQQLGDGRSGGGVGLGLAVARGFVEVVGGRIRAAATPGGGLTMRFTVPAVSREHTGSEVLQ